MTSQRGSVASSHPETSRSSLEYSGEALEINQQSFPLEGLDDRKSPPQIGPPGPVLVGFEILFQRPRGDVDGVAVKFVSSGVKQFYPDLSIRYP